MCIIYEDIVLGDKIMILGGLGNVRSELLGSYEQEMTLKGNPEDFSRPTVHEIQQNWDKYKSYAMSKHFMHPDYADELIALTTLDLATEEFSDYDDLLVYKNLEAHIKTRIDTVYQSEQNNTSSSVRRNLKEESIERDYKGSDKDTKYDLTDRKQVQKGDGLEKSLINIKSEIEEVKPYRYLPQGVDMFKVLHLLLCTEEYVNEGETRDFSAVQNLLQNVYGYDAEALEAIKCQLCGNSRFNELWKSLYIVSDGLAALRTFIGCSEYIESVFKN